MLKIVFVRACLLVLMCIGWGRAAKAQRLPQERLEYSAVPVLSAVPFAKGTISTADSSEFDIRLVPK